jgi:hypothetical protein
MSGGYTLNGNSYGGSFILEGSTDGTSWDVMVAKTTNNTFLGREGLSTAGGNISSGYNSTALSNTAFSIYKPDGTYTPVTTISTPSYTGLLRQFEKTSCKVTISGGNFNLNTMFDFNIHCVKSNISYPYWSTPTKFNCVVTNYTSGNGELIFDATPDQTGTSIFAIIVRSGNGSGVVSVILPSPTFTVEQPIIKPFWPSNINTTSFKLYGDSSVSNLLWDETQPPLVGLGAGMSIYPNYWIKFVDMTMYKFSDGTQVTAENITQKFQQLAIRYQTPYYTPTYPEDAIYSLIPTGVFGRYNWVTKFDFKWGYSGLTQPSRIALCLDNGVQGQADQSPGNPTPIYDWHNANGTTWKLWGAPNKNYNAGELTLLGTFNTSHYTRSRGQYKWNNLTVVAGEYFTHYWWQQSQYGEPGTAWSCPPILGQ